VLDKSRIDGSKIYIAEATIADPTGLIILTLKNDQIPVAVSGSTITVRNGRIEMFKGHMRLVVDQWGLIEPATNENKISQDVSNVTNNLSATEYELVNVDEGNEQPNRR